MEITFDKEADAVYIYLKKKKVFETKEITDDTIADLDKDGNVIGIEILSASKRIPIEKLSNVKITTPSK
jgi:uncharacterized protein YuzE